MPSVYLETSVIGYLASRPSADLITAGKQQATREWWDKFRTGYSLFVAPPVLTECLAGDPAAATERMVYLKDIPVLPLSGVAEALAQELLRDVPLPPKAEVDALHIAIAADRQLEFLLTWNCKHIANPSLRRRIELVIRAVGLIPPVICTPLELKDA